MRRFAPCLLFLLLPVLGCGGGGGDEDPEEVLLAVWPFETDSTSSALFDTVTIGFTGDRVPSVLDEPVLLAVDVQDGQEGLQARVDEEAGGGPFAAQAERLTDGLDSTLAVLVEGGLGTGGRRRLESEALQGLVPVAPDLRGARVTAFQVDLVRTSIEQGLVDLPEKRGEAGADATEPGTIVQLEGQVRILGIPGPTEE